MANTQLQAVAVLLLLAAFAYLLYLWTRRRNQVDCPSCGASIDVYEEECPYCGQERGADLAAPEEELTEAPASATAGEVAEPEPSAPAVDYDELVQEHTVAEVKDRVDADDLDPAKVLEAEKRHKDRVTLTDWLENRVEE